MAQRIAGAPADVRQLGLDGRETEHPITRPRPLSDRQRELLRYMRGRDVVRPVEIGQKFGSAPRRHASSDGVDALKRLEARGLVERVARGQWRATAIVEVWR